MDWRWAPAALWWLPSLAVAAMVPLALLAALAQAPGAARKAWIAAVLVLGAIAVAVSARQQEHSRTAIAEDAARALSAQAGELAAREQRIKDLEGQLQTLQEKSQARTIDEDKAARIADYLRGFGSQRVVVSCVPNDVEAYNYANRLGGVLRAGGWDALGPETTSIFGAAPSMSVILYARAGSSPEAAKILIDTFERFDIPHRSGLTPTDAIPDPATVELFVAPKS